MIDPDIKPPSAAVRPHVLDSPAGPRTDPYYWLRDDERTDPEVLAHLAAENAYRQRCMAATKPLEDALYEEIVARIKPDESGVPYRKQGYWYNTRFEAGKEHPLFVRRKDQAGAAEEILLDVNALAAGHDYYRIGGFEVSPDQAWLAYCEDTVGRRQFALRFKDLRSGEILAAAIADVEADLAWADDSRTLLYVEKDPDTLLGLYVKKHRLGEDPSLDARVFEQTDKTFYTGVSKSKSGRFIFISMESTVSSEWRYADAGDPGLAFCTILPHQRDHEYQIEHLADAFYVRSNWQARDFRLMRAPIAPASSPDEWTDVVAPRAGTFIEDFDVFDGFVALDVRAGGRARIAIVALPGGPLGEGPEFFIDGGDDASAASLSVNAELGSTSVRYLDSSLATPTTVYDYDVRTRQKVLLKRDPVVGAFDPADYATELLFAPARDGQRIPVSLVYRRGVARDGTAPLLQYAYGAYGLSIDPAFSSARLSLLDRGFVYAIAHVRGGQEMGREWYDAGRTGHKCNTFHDFIDVTRHLVAARYAARERVFAMGGSAGGLTVGAVANFAAGDYRGIVAQVPFVDVVTTMLDDGIPLTTNEYDEWGNPNVRAECEYMLKYSPYDNVRAQDYPALFVTTGLWDSQVQYYEPVKWVAKIRAQSTGRNPALLHIDMEAGHGGKAGRFQRYREIAMEYAFVLDLAGSRA